VIRPVSGSESTVALDDELTLVARAGRLATWPAFYAACCAGLQHYGLLDATGYRTLPLIELRSHMANTCALCADESRLVHLDDAGVSVRLTGFPKLLEMVLHWRQKRIEWQQENNAPFTALDEALVQRLELRGDVVVLVCCHSRIHSALTLERVQEEISKLVALNVESDAARFKASLLCV